MASEEVNTAAAQAAAEAAAAAAKTDNPAAEAKPTGGTPKKAGDTPAPEEPEKPTEEATNADAPAAEGESDWWDSWGKYAAIGAGVVAAAAIGYAVGCACTDGDAPATGFGPAM